MNDDIRDDELILYVLGELSAEEAKPIEFALTQSQSLQSRVTELQTTLNLTDHWHVEPDHGFDQRLWNQIEANLPTSKATTAPTKSTWFNWLGDFIREPAFVFSLVAVAIVSAFMGGRLMEHQEILDNPEAMIASLDDAARQNILMQSVSMHFERTSRLMTTVAVSNQAELNETEQAWAAQLLTSNRLFKSAAQNANQWRIVSLLDELEPILIEMANADETSLSNRQYLKQRIDDKGLVFKTRHYASPTRPAI